MKPRAAPYTVPEEEAVPQELVEAGAEYTLALVEAEELV